MIPDLHVIDYVGLMPTRNTTIREREILRDLLPELARVAAEQSLRVVTVPELRRLAREEDHERRPEKPHP